jgi:colanic acid/amylovoran biosynthesis glycosyltransferase
MDTIAYSIKKYLNTTETFIYEPLKNIRNFQVIILTETKRNLQNFPHPAVYSTSDLSRFEQIEEGVLNLFGRSPYFEQTLRKKKAKLIHAHFAWEGFKMMHVKRRLGLPLITSFYGVDIFKHTRNPLYRMQLSRLFEAGDLFLAITDNMRRFLIERLDGPAEKIITHYGGADLRKFPFSIRKPSNEISIIMCGRLIEKKGFEYGIRAFARAFREHSNIKMKIIGTGPLWKKLEELIGSLSLKNEIRLLGSKNYTDYIKELGKSNILLAPSIESADGDREGLPTVLYEALSMGIPTVATRYSGIPELIKDGANGFLVEEKNIDELTGKLITLIENKDLWQKFGTAGRGEIEENFDMIKQTKKLEGYYQKLIDDNARGAN